MPANEALHVFWRSLETKSYYEILGAAPDADTEAIQAAFHSFSRVYHPDEHVESSPDAIEIAGDIFKRAVEAYRCLSRPLSRERYDRGLHRGRLRLDPLQAATPPPPTDVRTLETLARTLEGIAFAQKADRLISTGHLDEARVELANACKWEPYNHELSERLHLLYEALELSSS
jgi:curved DNA-binding protein CbpA